MTQENKIVSMDQMVEYLLDNHLVDEFSRVLFKKGLSITGKSSDDLLRHLATTLKDNSRVADLLAIIDSDAAICETMTIGAYGSLFIRPMVFDKTHRVVEGHQHHYDHTTLIPTGTLNAQVWACNNLGKRTSKIHEEQKKAFSWMDIAAKNAHSFRAVTPKALGLCAFSHRDYK